ncbi:MAG: hypothetical protein Q7V05_04585 [Methanoregula sp.]|nr:hypothetical protein [Methanoregula sp.]
MLNCFPLFAKFADEIRIFLSYDPAFTCPFRYEPALMIAYGMDDN